MFKNFRRFLNYAKTNYLIGVISLIVTDIISLFIPYITGRVIDLIYTNSIDLNSFIRIISIALFLVIIKYITAIGWSYNIFKASSMMEYISRKKLMQKFLDQSQRFFEKNPTGSLMSKSTQDVQQIAQFAGFGVLAFFDAALFPVFIILVMIISVDFKMTLFSVLPLPLLAFGYYKLGDIIYDKSKAVNQKFDELTNTVLEDIEGIRIIRVYNIVNLRSKIFKNKARELADRNVSLVKTIGIIEPVEKIVTSLTFVIAIYYGAYMVSKGLLTLGQIVSFTYYLNMLVWPMFALGEFINLSQQASAAMDRIHDVLNYKEEIINTDDNKKVMENPSINYVDLSYNYPSNKELILDGINLKIDKGTSIGILGKTGSGKSTLVKQLLDLYKVDKNSILIGDDYYSEISSKSLKDKMGYVPQRHMIFSDTIYNNIKFSNPDASDEEINEAVRIADFDKDVGEFSEGLQTITGERGVSLSGGQKQRLAISRAILNNPDILILDDAMSAVDANTENNILKNLREIRDGKTTIIIAHRISQVQDLDNIIVLEDGKIIEEGTHDELMSEDSRYKRQYINQMSGGINA